jgi:hypothetical protein
MACRFCCAIHHEKHHFNSSMPHFLAWSHVSNCTTRWSVTMGCRWVTIAVPAGTGPVVITAMATTGAAAAGVAAAGVAAGATVCASAGGVSAGGPAATAAAGDAPRPLPCTACSSTLVRFVLFIAFRFSLSSRPVKTRASGASAFYCPPSLHCLLAAHAAVGGTRGYGYTQLLSSWIHCLRLASQWGARVYRTHSTSPGTLRLTWH